MSTYIHDEPRMVAAAERQLLAWAQRQENAPAFEGAKTTDGYVARGVNFVSISRETGTDGPTVARLVADRLGWEMHGKSLLDQMATRYGDSRSMLDLVDEAPNNWFFNVFGTWFDRSFVANDKYVAHLVRVMRLLAHRGNAVFLGRGANFVIPADRTVAVRLVAPSAYRVQRVMQCRSVDRTEAQRFVETIDRGRREFVDRVFHHRIDDASLYHLTINVAGCGIAGAVDLILAAVRSRQQPPSLTH